MSIIISDGRALNCFTIQFTDIRRNMQPQNELLYKKIIYFTIPLFLQPRMWNQAL